MIPKLPGSGNHLQDIYDDQLNAESKENKKTQEEDDERI